jgi:hypothetical protein
MTKKNLLLIVFAIFLIVSCSTQKNGVTVHCDRGHFHKIKKEKPVKYVRPYRYSLTH